MDKFEMPRLHGTKDEQFEQMKRYLFMLVEQLNMLAEQLEEVKENKRKDGA